MVKGDRKILFAGLWLWVFLALYGCASLESNAPETDIYQGWIGKDSDDLIQRFGQPEHILSDFKGGQWLVYPRQEEGELIIGVEDFNWAPGTTELQPKARFQAVTEKRMLFRVSPQGLIID